MICGKVEGQMSDNIDETTQQLTQTKLQKVFTRKPPIILFGCPPVSEQPGPCKGVLQ